MRPILAALSALSFAALSNAALLRAELIPVVINVKTNGQEAVEFAPDGFVTQERFYFSQTSFANDDFNLEWRLSGTSGEGISAQMSLTNLAPESVLYSIILSMPAGPFLPATSTGYFFNGGVEDLNGNGATWSTTPGRPLDAALLDGEIHWSYHPSAVNIVVPAGGSGGFVEPIGGERQPGIAVFSNVGIRYDFSLTSHDRVSLRSILHVMSAALQPHGDLNADWEVNNLDIAAMALALTDPVGYRSAYPTTPLVPIGDLNADGAFNNLDIAPFTALLVGSGAQGHSVPEPSGSVLALAALLALKCCALTRARSAAKASLDRILHTCKDKGSCCDGDTVGTNDPDSELGTPGEDFPRSAACGRSDDWNWARRS